jgi:hypothetical protein
MYVLVYIHTKYSFLAHFHFQEDLKRAIQDFRQPFRLTGLLWSKKNEQCVKKVSLRKALNVNYDPLAQSVQSVAGPRSRFAHMSGLV